PVRRARPPAPPPAAPRSLPDLVQRVAHRRRFRRGGQPARRAPGRRRPRAARGGGGGRVPLAAQAAHRPRHAGAAGGPGPGRRLAARDRRGETPRRPRRPGARAAARHRGRVPGRAVPPRLGRTGGSCSGPQPARAVPRVPRRHRTLRRPGGRAVRPALRRGDRLMRPLLLRLDHFGSFRGPVEVDFSDVDYFALTGPTGSGKSTIIDAICFALYGTVPRWGRENVIAHALAPSVSAGKVALLFESGGRRYGVVRALVRDSKGTVRTKEARIDELAAGVPLDQAWEAVVKPLAEGEQVTPEVQRVTGLEYRFFTQCVVLPQGRFAEFLHAAPRERQDLLVQLLDADVYEAIRQRAVREEETARSAASLARDQLGKLSGATAELEAEL